MHFKHMNLQKYAEDFVSNLYETIYNKQTIIDVFIKEIGLKIFQISSRFMAQNTQASLAVIVFQTNGHFFHHIYQTFGTFSHCN